MRFVCAAIGLVLVLALAGCILDAGGPGHVHRDGCGHYYWHDSWWDSPHPANCTTCPPQGHVHAHGCGHYYWHNAWYDTPHPEDCAVCRPRVHVHGDGCGHHHWHNGWHDTPHPIDCHG